MAPSFLEILCTNACQFALRFGCHIFVFSVSSMNNCKATLMVEVVVLIEHFSNVSNFNHLFTFKDS